MSRDMRWVTFGCYGTLVRGLAGEGPVRVFDDVEPMLAALRDRGWRLGVLTNCGDRLFEQTHQAFRHPFDMFVTGERVRGLKPSLWHFRAFEQLTGASRRDWVHVSSSRHRDIAPARAFGVSTVWLDRDRTQARDVALEVDRLFDEEPRALLA